MKVGLIELYHAIWYSVSIYLFYFRISVLEGYVRFLLPAQCIAWYPN
jgi:hypothetical protein